MTTPTPLPAADAPSIHEAIIAASAAIKPVAKETVQGLRYPVRSWDAVADAIAEPLRTNGLIVTTTDHEVKFVPGEMTGLNHVGKPIGSMVMVTIHITIRHATTGGTVTGAAVGVAPWTLTNPVGAARTFALREWICRLFMIPFEGGSSPEEQVERAARGAQSNGGHPVRTAADSDTPDVAEIRADVLARLGCLTPEQKDELVAWCATQDLRATRTAVERSYTAKDLGLIYRWLLDLAATTPDPPPAPQPKPDGAKDGLAKSRGVVQRARLKQMIRDLDDEGKTAYKEWCAECGWQPTQKQIDTLDGLGLRAVEDWMNHGTDAEGHDVTPPDDAPKLIQDDEVF